MRVFVTGATGWIGSVVVRDLIAAGHQVLGLSRSDQGADALRAGGAEVLRGTLADLDILKSGAAQADGVIHLAFNHDFSKFAENCEDEARAIRAISDALRGSGHPFIITSGVALLAPGRLATEADVRDPATTRFPRVCEEVAAELAGQGLRVTTVRLAPTVHGHGDHGFVPGLIAIARRTGVSAYIGDGQNRWPAVHRLDAARVFRLALEAGAQGGPFHAIAEEGVALKEIAQVIGRRLDLPVVSITPEEAPRHFGAFAVFAGIDAPASSERTRVRLNWQPTQPELLTDLDHPAYFGGAL
ncbi:MAG: SDR family oxidoreductase [Azospirillaceae bacterium]|nr:SDR family oxidoreductase [Azospirillaceae bacterium]